MIRPINENLFVFYHMQKMYYVSILNGNINILDDQGRNVTEDYEIIKKAFEVQFQQGSVNLSDSVFVSEGE
ncbi:MAG: hypothetical protein QXV17_10255 [Candidatus Micrarchaeaceae archaeon]